MNGTVGATTPSTGAFTTLSTSGAFTTTGGSNVQTSWTLAEAGTRSLVLKNPTSSLNASVGTGTNHDLEVEGNNVYIKTGSFGARSTVGTFSSTGLAVTGLTDISAATSGQIKFPATQNASTNANTLDDYEEGTWTPTIAAGYTGVTYNNQNGRYTKVGRLVTLTCYLQFSGTFDASSISVGSLPFDLASVTAGNCGTVGYWDVTTDGNLSAYIATSTTVVFYKIGTSSSAISIGNVTNKYIVFSITGSI